MGYRNKIVKEESGTVWLYVGVPSNLNIAFLSKTGKSLVFRVKGLYIDSKGYFKGSEDSISGYINQPLAWVCTPIKRGYYTTEDIFNYDFGNGEMSNTIKIPLREYCINN